MPTSFVNFRKSPKRLHLDKLNRLPAKQRLATWRQVAYMEQHNIIFSSTCTVQEATDLITEFQSRHDPADDQHPYDLD
jgi:hypothetical protein